jgi:subtilisin family serine protease
MLVAPWALAGTWYEPDELVRVDDPAHPDAIARSATGAILVGPPEDGIPYRSVVVPEIDRVEVSAPAAEALDVVGARSWHADGVRGEGVKVAVFDSNWFVGETDPVEVQPFQTHDCFASATCEVAFDLTRPALTNESGAHGWACAEVVRDLAPDAEVHLVRVNSLTAYENAVDWAIREGVDVISMSMSYYNQSFYDGTGPQAELVERLVGAGVLLVTSAGNTADQHWAGRYLDVDGDGRMDVDGEPGLYTWLGEGSATVYLNWDERDACGRTDLWAQLVDERGWVLDRNDDPQDPDDDDCEPYERLRATVASTGWYRIEVGTTRGDATGLAIDLLSRDGIVSPFVPEGSVTDPAAHPLAFAVGAVRASDYLAGDLQSYSSWGPNHAGAMRPDIAGPDGLSTATYGPTGFFGTSASTPVVAGMVALVLSDDPSLTPREAAERLQGWARTDRPAVGPDPRWGAGKARLPRRDPRATGCGRGPLLLGFLPMLLVGVPWRWPARPARGAAADARVVRRRTHGAWRGEGRSARPGGDRRV